jgi:hypothetical protein
MRMRSKLLHLAAAGMFALSPAASGAEAAGEPPDILGGWGGEGVVLTLTGSGGHIEWGCQSAEIDGPVTPSRRGRFKATGRIHPGFFGPAILPVPESRKPRPVRYRGRIQEDRMHLVIIRRGSLWPGEQRRTELKLQKGREVRLHRCL